MKIVQRDPRTRRMTAYVSMGLSLSLPRSTGAAYASLNVHPSAQWQGPSSALSTASNAREAPSSPNSESNSNAVLFGCFMVATFG
jgi:hypothetical protein